MPVLSLRSGNRFGTGRLREALSSTSSRNSASNSAAIIGWPAHVLGLLVGLLTQLIWHSPRENGDWAALWIAGKLLRQGDDPHIYDYAPDDFAAWAGPFWQPFAQQDVTSASPHPFVQAPFVAQMAEALTFVMSFHTSVFFFDGGVGVGAGRAGGQRVLCVVSPPDPHGRVGRRHGGGVAFHPIPVVDHVGANDAPGHCWDRV